MKHKQVTLDQVIMLDFNKYKWNASNCFNCIICIQIALKRKYYSSKSKQQIILRKKLAFYAATSSFSTSQCENEDFNNYIHHLDPRHRLPCRQRLTKDIVQLAKRGRLLIKKRIHSALTKKIATADIWPIIILLRYNLKFTELILVMIVNLLLIHKFFFISGVTLQYINMDHAIEKVVLELASFPPPQTGNAVAELVRKVFLDWELKVPIIVTDNGINMVKAFKHTKANHVKEIIDSVAKNSIDQDEETDPNLFSDMSDV